MTPDFRAFIAVAALITPALAQQPGIKLSDVVGLWHAQAMVGPKDSVVTTLELVETATDTGWTMKFPRAAPVAVRLVMVAGDSIVTEAGPYPSTSRPGQTVVLRTVGHYRSDEMWGTFEANYSVSGNTSGKIGATRAKTGQVVLTYLGTAGWEISDGSTILLIDPYLSRINGPRPPAAGLAGTPIPGDTRPFRGWDDVAVPDAATIDAHIHRADFILVTHTHYDHVLDVPHIALKTRATVVGTESTENVMRAYGVPEDQLITVRGGEDYEFGVCSVKVIPSIHSSLDHKHYFSSETAPAGMKAPLTLRQIHPEGGTLAYLIRFHGHQILAFGSMNYIEREIEGLRPDIALVGAAPSRKEIHDYTGRLMRALNFPAVVLPTHWDNFIAPYGTPQQAALDALQGFVQEVKAASPKTEVIVPKYFEPIQLRPVE